MAHEALPERAVAQEVHVLFFLDQVRRQRVEFLPDLGGEAGGGHHDAELGLAQVAQPPARQPVTELQEIEGGVALFQVLVKQVGVGKFAEVVELFPEEEAVGPVLPRGRARQEVEQGAGADDLSVRRVVGAAADVVGHHVADHAAHVPAGVGVVADEADAVGRQVAAQMSRILPCTSGGTQE